VRGVCVVFEAAAEAGIVGQVIVIIRAFIAHSSLVLLGKGAEDALRRVFSRVALLNFYFEVQAALLVASKELFLRRHFLVLALLRNLMLDNMMAIIRVLREAGLRGCLHKSCLVRELLHCGHHFHRESYFAASSQACRVRRNLPITCSHDLLDHL